MPSLHLKYRKSTALARLGIRTNMERDSHLTFREIHGSRENLVLSVADILGKALVEVVEDDAPLNLRFITPYQFSTDWPTDENCSQYALTLPGELPPGQEYISVSYTWAHSQEIDPSTPIPDYRIKDQATPDAPFRSINCPTMVFHRAWCFARARNIPYIWIDQECIYQENAEDKERHLQIMDRIYKKSKWTVAILSTEIPDTMLSALALVPLNNRQEWYRGPYFENWPADVELKPLYVNFYVDFLNNTTNILSSVLSDPWFTRAWTFQERHCASACVLLAPTGNKSEAVAQLPLDWFGNDVSLTYRSLREISRYHRHLNDPGNPGDALDRIRLYSLLYESDQSEPTSYDILFYMLEGCDNLICSDRLTIFANACGFRYKLNSTLLNDAEYSYSTCMIALMMANEWEYKTSVWADDIKDFLVAHRINIWKLDLNEPIEGALRKTGRTHELGVYLYG
ncbi:hypothetical protein CUC08_Gglean001777 [Alternaria sp. MG1]|nr:hypothetical protein CUC08_Gglean001777 [Alternaria sp. MG1]